MKLMGAPLPPCGRMLYEPLFYDVGVDAVFVGHVHAYERTLPMFNYTVRLDTNVRTFTAYIHTHLQQTRMHICTQLLHSFALTEPQSTPRNTGPSPHHQYDCRSLAHAG